MSLALFFFVSWKISLYLNNFLNHLECNFYCFLCSFWFLYSTFSRWKMTARIRLTWSKLTCWSWRKLKHDYKSVWKGTLYVENSNILLYSRLNNQWKDSCLIPLKEKLSVGRFQERVFLWHSILLFILEWYNWIQFWISAKDSSLVV